MTNPEDLARSLDADWPPCEPITLTELVAEARAVEWDFTNWCYTSGYDAGDPDARRMFERLLAHARRGGAVVEIGLIGHANWPGEVLQHDRGFGFILPDDGGPDDFRACPRRRKRRHEDIGGRPSARIQDRPRARWPIKGGQSSLALRPTLCAGMTSDGAARVLCQGPVRQESGAGLFRGQSFPPPAFRERRHRALARRLVAVGCLSPVICERGTPFLGARDQL
jgi:hypothetical protein